MFVRIHQATGKRKRMSRRMLLKVMLGRWENDRWMAECVVQQIEDGKPCVAGEFKYMREEDLD